PRHRAILSLDSPFPTWHDLTRCYTGQGWEIEGQSVVTAPPGREPADGFVEVVMKKPAYRCGYLLFAQFDAHGTLLEPRRGGMYLSLYRHDSALRRLTGAEGPPPDPPGPIYQVQLFIESHAPLTAGDQADAQALFLGGLPALCAAGSGPETAG